jgi:hypothetical protein
MTGVREIAANFARRERADFAGALEWRHIFPGVIKNAIDANFSINLPFRKASHEGIR